MKKDKNARAIIVKVEIESKEISHPVYFSLNCESLVSMETSIAIHTALLNFNKDFTTKHHA
jgi:hypothetical protein